MAKNQANRRVVNSKLKKTIIAVVIFLAVALGGVVAFSLLSKVSTTTVYDLRFVEHGTKNEIIEKEVFLTASESNKFEVDLKVSASAMTNFFISSSDNSVASVSSKGDHYVVSYFKVGEVSIFAQALDNSTVRDEFVLKVKENFPIEFEITDEKRVSENEVSIFADGKDYEFDFLATSIDKTLPVNNDTFFVLDDFNKEVFSTIEVLPTTSKILIKAKQNINSTREFITVACKTKDVEGNEKTIANYLLIVNVNGNYIQNLQFEVATNPRFDGDKYVYGSGALKSGETRLTKERLVFCEDVNIFYVKVRILFTNGDFKYVTNEVITETYNTNMIDSTLVRPGNTYFEIKVDSSAKNNVSGTGIKFTYPPKNEQPGIEETLTVYFLADASYESFLENDLYEKYTDEEDGGEYYRFIHWDERYKRNDAITKNGKIVGFLKDDLTGSKSSENE